VACDARTVGLQSGSSIAAPVRAFRQSALRAATGVRSSCDTLAMKFRAGQLSCATQLGDVPAVPASVAGSGRPRGDPPWIQRCSAPASPTRSSIQAANFRARGPRCCEPGSTRSASRVHFQPGCAPAATRERSIRFGPPGLLSTMALVGIQGRARCSAMCSNMVAHFSAIPVRAGARVRRQSAMGHMQAVQQRARTSDGTSRNQVVQALFRRFSPPSIERTSLSPRGRRNRSPRGLLRQNPASSNAQHRDDRGHPARRSPRQATGTKLPDSPSSMTSGRAGRPAAASPRPNWARHGPERSKSRW